MRSTSRRYLWRLGRLVLVLLVVTPAAAWMLVKPVRVLAPQWVGVECPTATVCVEDKGEWVNAATLHADAMAFVDHAVGILRTSPRVIFCSTQHCAESFGLGARSAVTVGTWGTVIGPRAWKPYYVRHEMIHVLQAERLGVLGLLRKPAWFKEGMAYDLSEDPRQPLNEPFETQRNAFRQWYLSIDPTRLWIAADAL
jgi:hypothetical protein